MIDSEFYFSKHLRSKHSPEQVTSGYTTEEDCKKWPREVLLRCHSSSPYLAFIFLFSYQISSINLINQFNLCDYKVCTISKETKRKFNPVTKCEKVALETAMDF